MVATGAVDPDGDQLTYTLLGDSGAPVIGTVSFRDMTFRTVYDAYSTVTADDGRDDRRWRRLMSTFQNLRESTPVIQLAQVIEKNGFRSPWPSTSDPNNDDLTYEIDWGDGTPAESGGQQIWRHVYPDGQFNQYTASVTVRDGRGGADSSDVSIEFAAPPANQGPAIERVDVVDQTGFRVVLLTSASDPDGDALTYTVNWGDGSNAETSGSDVATHTYPEEYRAYQIVVSVTDLSGDTASRIQTVTFEAPPATKPCFHPVLSQDEFQVAAASATDADGDSLSYEFEWVMGALNTISATGVANTAPRRPI